MNIYETASNYYLFEVLNKGSEIFISQKSKLTNQLKNSGKFKLNGQDPITFIDNLTDKLNKGLVTWDSYEI